MPIKWEIKNRELVNDMQLFKVIKQNSYHAEKDMFFDFYVVESSDWVNVVPITKNDEVVMIEQYRAGTDSITLELPGGVIDAEDTNPVAAGIRELNEETGYHSESIKLLGSVHPNPAMQNNRCHFVLATDCVDKGIYSPDAVEDIAVKLVPLKEVPALLKDGTISHSLVHCAFQHLWMDTPKS
mgnify:CR=1 FL=1|jgi:ADP-ribose pyrophosphatase